MSHREISLERQRDEHLQLMNGVNLMKLRAMLRVCPPGEYRRETEIRIVPEPQIVIPLCVVLCMGFYQLYLHQSDHGSANSHTK